MKNNSDSTEKRAVLPRNVQPHIYEIELTPDLDTFTFSGKERIEISIQKSTRQIVLNAAELEILFAEISQNGTKEKSSLALDADKETLTLKFSNALQPGTAHLDIEFKGTLNDKLRGFYRSKYELDDGTEQYMATTQFEPADARKAFPCWDEPAVKAVFKLTLSIPKDRVALSNMNIIKEETRRNLKKIYFDQTPVMSTYLLAFIIGELEAVEAYTNNNTHVRILATPGKKEQLHFALDVGIRVLEYFEEYFGIPYPLSKLDMAAIPDFDAGAMENWGLVTFRERLLLLDKEKSSTTTKQWIAAIIAHELAHQWFGNLVTMKWWNDLWLNEGFATWIGNKAVDHLFPEWDMWTQFYSYNTDRGFGLDGLENTHPIEVEVKNPKEIVQIFDAISYAKGSSIIHMLENYLGQTTFQKGLSYYLSKHAYKNTSTQDLWDAFSRVSGKPVSQIMNTWTKQSGYPVVKVERTSTNKNCILNLKQQRFFYKPQARRKQNKTVWKIPIEITAPALSGPKHTLMCCRRKRIRLGKRANDSWIKLNTSQTGFFRINYSNELLQAFYPAIESLSLPSIDRLGLGSDVYALTRAQVIPVTQYLELVEHYRNETDYAIWDDLGAGLSPIVGRLRNEAYYKELREFARQIFIPIGRKVGWDPRDGEQDLDALLRSVVLASLGRYKDKDTIKQAKIKFQEFLQSPDSLTPDLRDVVCLIAAKNGNNTTYEALLDLYHSSPLQEEKMCYARALGRFKSQALLQKTLDFSLSSEVRAQDTDSVIASVAANAEGKSLAWEFVKENWDEFNKRYGDGGHTLSYLIKSITSGFSTRKEKQDIVEFFTKHPVPTADRALKQSLEQIDMNISWLRYNRRKVADWIQKKKSR